MAGKNWQAGSKDIFPARLLLSAAAMAASCGPAAAAPDAFAPASYIGSLDPNVLWEVLIGGVVVCAFLVAVSLWIHSALRSVKRSQVRRNAFVSSARNNLNQGVVMTDSRSRIVFVNERYLEIYGLSRSDLLPNMNGPRLLELRRARGALNLEDEDFYAEAARPEGLITELSDGRSILVRYFKLPNGGSIATHLDCTEQRKLSRELASTKQFLESVLDNVPVCVAVKNIEDGRYIFANRAFERFSRFSRDHIIGKRAEEIFRPETAGSIEVADEAALKAPEGHHRSEYFVERGDEKRVISSNRVVARNENNEPEFLINLFDDVTDRRSLSRERSEEHTSELQSLAYLVCRLLLE